MARCRRTQNFRPAPLIRDRATARRDRASPVLLPSRHCRRVQHVDAERPCRRWRARARATSPFHGCRRPRARRAARPAGRAGWPVQLADFDIGEQAEHRAAPDLRPQVSVLSRPWSPACGRPFGMSRIIACQISRRREVAGLHPRDRFDVDGETLRQPGVAIVEIGQGGMHHLVDDHPVAPQIVCAGVAAEWQPDRSTAIAPRWCRRVSGRHRPVPAASQRRTGNRP